MSEIDQMTRQRAYNLYNTPRYSQWEDAEDRFKSSVLYLIAMGIYPSPQELNERMFMHRRKTINGRSCKWRREICKEIGFKLKGLND